MTLVSGQQQTPHVNAKDSANIAELLAELATQIDNVRRLFDGPSPVLQSEHARAADVVFIDDLAHCMECSWAKLEAAGVQLTPDIVAQCGRLLEASLQILQQVEQQAKSSDTSP